MALVAATAWPLASQAPATVFQVRAWGTADGLPGSQVNAVAQDDDGSLWIGTLAGLVRFDGVSFEVFDEGREGLPSSRISVLERGSQGRLWIGTEQGHLIEYRNGRFRLRAEPPYPASRIVSMTEDPAGILWIARYADPTREMQPLVWQYHPEDGGEGRLVPRRDLDRHWMAVDRQGRAGILLHDGSVRPPPESSLVVALSRDTAGRVWGQMPLGRLVRLPDGLTDPAGESYAGANELHRTLVTHATGRRVAVLDPVSLQRLGSFAAGDGAYIWLVDRRGLLWVSDGQNRLSAFRGEDPAPVATVAVDAVLRDVTEDRDGNLWVGTLTRGLLRITESPLEAIGPERVPLPGAVGLTPQNELFVEPAPAGACYPLHILSGERAEPLGAACGWMLWDRGGTFWHFENGALGRRLVGRPPVGPERRLEVHATWMLEDPELDEVLWLVGERALMRLDTRAPGPLAVSATWPMAANRAIASDGLGGIWIGATDGLWNLRAGQLAHFGKAAGLPVENIRAILADGHGGLWLGTYGGGFVHFDGRTFVTLGVDRGLPEAVVSSLVEDGFGGIWFAGNRGIHRVRRENLERCLSDPGERLQVLSFGHEDGLVNPETTGRPAVAGPDGRIWFATFGGLVAVDPQVIARREAVAPQVLLLEVVSASGRRRRRSAGRGGGGRVARPQHLVHRGSISRRQSCSPSATGSIPWTPRGPMPARAARPPSATCRRAPTSSGCRHGTRAVSGTKRLPPRLWLFCRASARRSGSRSFWVCWRLRSWLVAGSTRPAESGAAAPLSSSRSRNAPSLWRRSVMSSPARRNASASWPRRVRSSWRQSATSSARR